MRIQLPISVVLAWTLLAALPAEAAVIIIVGDNDVSVASNSTYTVTESSSPIPALRAYATSTVRVSGGQIGTFDAVEFNHSSISGGTIQTFTLYHSAVSEILGGQIGQISTWDTNHVSWFGGNVGSFTLRDISTLTVYGKDLRLNLAGSSSHGWITGFLQDGTAINTPFILGPSARINLVPLAEAGSWDHRFGLPPGLDGSVSCFASIGSRLYVGGEFQTAGTNKIEGIACWDGSNWSALGDGIDGYVKAMVVHHGALYVGGRFNTRGSVGATNLAMWRRGRWHRVGGGVPAIHPRGVEYQEVKCLASAGWDLYVGGQFAQAGNVQALNVARWDGRKWSALGQGVGSREVVSSYGFLVIRGWVESLAVVNKRLYAGGMFNRAGGNPAQSIACWDGRKWSNVGGGLTDGTVERIATVEGEISGYVSTLAGYGPYLLAGGSFRRAGQVQATNVAFWDGRRWFQLAGGVCQDPGSGGGQVSRLHVQGASIYAGGFFQWAGGTPAANLAKFSRHRWKALGDGVGGYVKALIAKRDALVVGGYFGLAGSEPVASIARWDQGTWSGFGPPSGDVFTNAVFGTVFSIAVDGKDAYAGGVLYSVGNLRGPLHLAKWDGEKWSAPGGGLPDGWVGEVAASGGKVFVAGGFVIPQAGATNLAMWDGTNWSALGQGLQWIDATGAVSQGSAALMTVSSNKLFVSGWFNRAGGINATNLAIWDGANWHAVGDLIWLSDGAYPPTGPGNISSMAVSGPDLYVAGGFNQIGSASVTNLARWDGTTWLPVGEGLGLDFYQAGSIRAMSVFGTNVYLGGWFNSVGLPETTNIAGWNGSTWSALGNPFGMQDGIQFLASTEQFLYAAGSFTNAAGSLARNIARWDGAGWYALGEGLRYLNLYGRPYALSAGDGVVCVSGAFTEAGGLSSPQFAIWHEPPSAISLQRTIPPRPLHSVPPPPPVAITLPVSR